MTMKWIGMCDECLSVKEFDEETKRDLWEKFHPHLENYAEVEA